MARPDLDVWVIGGDGDMLSIGGNHLIHALRRNVNLTILMFNNQIYGLTKGQYSPTSEVGKVTKSTPFGSLDHPFNPDQPGARRRGDVRGPHPRHGPQAHDGDRSGGPTSTRARAFVEIYQNCNVFNDGAFDGDHRARTHRADMLIPLEHGEPIRFGADGEQGVMLDGQGRARDRRRRRRRRGRHPRARRAPRGPGAGVHAVAAWRRGPHEPTPIGVFRAVERPNYGAAMTAQLLDAQKQKGPGELSQLLMSGATWEV